VWNLLAEESLLENFKERFFAASLLRMTGPALSVPFEAATNAKARRPGVV